MYHKVYVILAHRNPDQLKDLVGLILDDLSSVFIHLDKKTPIEPFKNLISLPRCFFIKNRVRCQWGTFSLVEATINAYLEVFDYMNKNFEASNYHVILISGEDMPLKSPYYIHNYLSEKQNFSLINYWKLPYNGWWGGGWFRLKSLFLPGITHKVWYYRFNYFLTRIGCNYIKPYSRLKRHYPEMDVYGSSQWMILNSDTIKLLLYTIKTHPKLNSIFKYTFAPDEMYFISLLKLSSPEKVRISNTKNFLVIFEGSNANPNYLTITDIEEQTNPDILFGRKFDGSINKSAIDYIKKEILS